MAMLAIIAMLFMYLFATKQVTDTETPRIATFTHDVLERSLAPDSDVTLKLRARVAGGARHYELRLRPAQRLPAARGGVETLLARAAETVFEELSGRQGDVTLTCVAVLPDGERRVTYDRRMQKIPEPVVPSADDAE